MDSEFWTSRLAAAKRQYTLQHHHQSSHFDRLSIDDFEVEDEVRPAFPCPYCYEDFDIASLCSHLEDEHSCESKVTVCPICSVKVAQDMLSHITLQHGHLFKLQRRRRLRRVAIPNSQALSLLGRDLREAHLQVLLGSGGYRSDNANVSNAATDPFLSSLILNFPASGADEIAKSVVTTAEDISAKNVAPAHIWKSSMVDKIINLGHTEWSIHWQTFVWIGVVRPLQVLILH
ncbi:protein DEHYDRATION-INDUCED 19-like isoform X2 [Prunus avium]|uniref:Protein DEHYDRATION-INDUCED 19-like isoform X2 n=1 Tax=Prunus avium TaxID=42229 RepID=A0A6P5TSW1_PRUAV|nr:protein DEHYDRATION-INDUCED 19-like isoform X2 [Prunus avium]